MARIAMFKLSFFLLIHSLIYAISAAHLELEPLNKHKQRSSFRKREEDTNIDYSALDLQSEGIFLWGVEADTTMVIANLTLEFPQDYEAIIDMDTFGTFVKSIDCTAPELILDFKETKAFEYARNAWNWVKLADSYNFILVASAEACDPESRRDPFLVQDLSFDETGNRIIMRAEKREWEDVAVKYSFKVKNEPLPPSRMMKRDGKTLNLAHDFSRSLFNVNYKGLDIGISCSDCGTEGTLLIDVDTETNFIGVPVGASMSVTPQNLAAIMQLSLQLSGKLGSAYVQELNVVSVPITGIGIGSFFKIGLFVTVDVGIELSAIEGSASASVGARLTIPNTSNLNINLLGAGSSGSNGWIPVLTRLPPSLNAKIEGSAEAFAQAGIEVTAKLLKFGYSVGVDMRMPYVRAEFSALADTSGVCGTKKTLGVDVQATIGAEIVASAQKGNESPFWSKSVFDQSLGTLIDKCYPFGPENAGASGNGNGGNVPPKSTKKPKPTGSKKAISKKPTSKPKTSVPPKSARPITSSKTPKPKSSTKPPPRTSSTRPTSSPRPTSTDKTKNASSKPEPTTDRPSGSSDMEKSKSRSTNEENPTKTTSATRSSGSGLSSSRFWNGTATESPPKKTTDLSAPSSSSSSSASSSSSSLSSACGITSGTKSAVPCETDAPSSCAAIKERGTEDLEFQDDSEIQARSVHRSSRRAILARAGKKQKKSGRPCPKIDFQLESDEYPSISGLPANAPVWGFHKQDDLCDYVWESGQSPRTPNNNYDTEHVLEWQILTDFFTKFNEGTKGEYDHPNPDQGGKTDFCTYWYETWNLGPGEEFTVAASGAVPLSPWEHIAAAYPSTNNQWAAELIALQSNINSGPKSSLFIDKIQWIWRETDMDKMARKSGKDNRETVLARLRRLVGAKKYLVDNDIKAIFKQQVERIGVILDELDKQLENRPRKVGGTEFNRWKQQGLKAAWELHVDEKWRNAVAKFEKVIDRWSGLLEDTHCSKQRPPTADDDKKFCDQLKKMEAEYQSLTWSKPW